MTYTATCPNCGTVVTLEPAPVYCVRCGRKVRPGHYVIAPAGSRYAGCPVCCECIDGQAAENLMGPSEVK